MGCVLLQLPEGAWGQAKRINGAPGAPKPKNILTRVIAYQPCA